MVPPCKVHLGLGCKFVGRSPWFLRICANAGFWVSFWRGHQWAKDVAKGQQQSSPLHLVSASQHIPIWVFPKIMVPPNHPILIWFFIINHPFWGTPILGNTHMRIWDVDYDFVEIIGFSVQKRCLDSYFFFSAMFRIEHLQGTPLYSMYVSLSPILSFDASEIEKAWSLSVSQSKLKYKTTAFVHPYIYIYDTKRTISEQIGRQQQPKFLLVSSTRAEKSSPFFQLPNIKSDEILVHDRIHKNWW